MQSKTTKDLSVTLPDKPGTLFKATDAVAKRGINIEGYCLVPTGKEETFHLLTSDPSGPRKALEDAGFPVREELDAFTVQIPEGPSRLTNVLRPIADAEVKVALSYSLADGRTGSASRDITAMKQAFQEAQ